MPKNPSHKYSSERGSTIVMAIGVVSMCLLFGAFAINAARYYSYRIKLQHLADSVAQYAGTALPNPKLAFEQGQHLFHILSNDLRTTKTRVTDTTGSLSMVVYLNYANLPGSSGGGTATGEPKYEQINLGTITAGTNVSYSSTGVKLPIKSMTFEIKGTFNIDLLLFKSASGFASLAAKAFSTTQLIPTDIVLVVENSNSVISPLADESSGRQTAIEAIFPWPDTIGRTGNYGPSSATAISYTPITKALVHARQCYGTNFLSLKKGALFLYDMLTASATYRVSVIMSSPPSGESGLPLIWIPDRVVSSYARYPINRGSCSATNCVEPAFSEPGLYNQRYGSIEYPETRCAALQSISDFRVPAHPLNGNLDPSFRNSIFAISAANATSRLDTKLKCDGSKTGCANLTNFEFDSTDSPSILARELLWLQSAGETYERGLPNPIADLVHWQYPILRAMDYLQQAPKREDNLRVTRKIVLVLNDGFEKAFSVEAGFNYTATDTAFNRVNEVIKGASDFTQQSLPYTYGDANTSIFENFCTASTSNAIDTNSKIQSAVSDNAEGIKLGILYNGARSGTFASSDPLSFLEYLPNHDASSTNLDEFRSACNTKWIRNRGRFMAESSAVTFSTNTRSEQNAAYYEKVIPAVLRSILVSEVVQ